MAVARKRLEGIEDHPSPDKSRAESSTMPRFAFDLQSPVSLICCCSDLVRTEKQKLFSLYLNSQFSWGVKKRISERSARTLPPNGAHDLLETNTPERFVLEISRPRFFTILTAPDQLPSDSCTPEPHRRN